MNFHDMWPYLVVLLLAAIAYRLYKIQDALSGGPQRRALASEQRVSLKLKRQERWETWLAGPGMPQRIIRGINISLGIGALFFAPPGIVGSLFLGLHQDNFDQWLHQGGIGQTLFYLFTGLSVFGLIIFLPALLLQCVVAVYRYFWIRIVEFRDSSQSEIT